MFPRSWANNEHILKPIVSARRQLHESMDPFARLLMSHDSADLQKVVDKGDIVAKCSKFSLELDPVVQTLQSETKQLTSMHASRSSASGSRSAKRARTS